MADQIFCSKCGHFNEGGSAFCSACGTPLAGKEVATSSDPTVRSSAATFKKIVPIAIIAAAAAICALAFVYVQNFKPVKIDLTSSVSKAAVIATGQDGEGIVDIDEVALRNGADYPQGNKRAEKFMKTVTYEVDQDSKLSNGDRVTLTAQFSQSTAEKYHIEVSNPTRKFTITGLAKKDEEENTSTATNGNININLYDKSASDVYDDYTVPVWDDDITDDLNPASAQKAINDIYARHGYIFSDDGEWQMYYESKSWYVPLYNKMSDAEKDMTKAEKDNIKYLAAIRDGGQ